MNDILKDVLTNVEGKDIMTQFLSILELEDEKFDVIYPRLKDEMINAFELNATRKSIIAQLETMPQINLKEEVDNLNKTIEEIKNDNSLSDNKKDMLITLLSKSAEITFSLLKNPRELISVKVQKINEDAILPTYAHDTDAGADIYAIEDCKIAPHSTTIVKTGLKIAIPAGYEIQIRPRSGLSLKTNLRIANAPGTIDAEYRGEVGVIVENTGNLTATISKGDKIAQMVVMPVPMIKWEEVDELSQTSRGEGGYGSTDKS